MEPTTRRSMRAFWQIALAVVAGVILFAGKGFGWW